MLRALSQTEPPESRNALAAQRLGWGATIGDLFSAVSIVNPGGSYTLATEHSPLPLALRQRSCRCPIRVRLQVDAPPGMTVTDIGEQELPPGYLPVRVPVEVHFTQRVAVDVGLRTPDGLQLGEPVRLSVHSNAYGKVLFAITLLAGAVLALLVGRRLYHRASAASPTRPTSTGPAGTRPAAAREPALPPASGSSQPPLPHPPAGPTPGQATGVDRRGGGLPVVGHGVGHPDQPHHRVHPDRALAAILGAALSSAFSVANQLPNLVAALVLEATTAIFVPVLARAERDDSDGGEAFVRRLVTLATTRCSSRPCCRSRRLPCWCA
jgi:hypothetical protein